MLYTSCLGYKIWKYNTSPKYLFAVGSVSLVELIIFFLQLLVSTYLIFFNLKKYFDSWNQNLDPNYLVEFKVNKHFTEIKIISKLAFQLNTNYETKT